MIQISKLNKHYEKDGTIITVLEDLSLAVEPGKAVALMGPSGVGKTTVLNIVAGLDTDVSGDVNINDVHILDKSSQQLDEYRNTTIGFIFQEFNLLPHLNAVENAILPLMFGNTTYAEAVAAGKKALETVGLGSRMQRMPAELSGGQKQRVAVARALINNPQIILADEPTANLDRATEKTILDLIFSLTRTQKVMTLISTHRQDIADMADEIVRLPDNHLIHRKEDDDFAMNTSEVDA